MTDMLIETPIDELVKLIKAKEKMTVSEAAKELGVSQTQIEDWVRVLEEKDFVELKYPAMGEPVIILKTVTDRTMNKKEKEIKKEKEKIEKKTEKFEEKITNTERR